MPDTITSKQRKAISIYKNFSISASAQLWRLVLLIQVKLILHLAKTCVTSVLFTFEKIAFILTKKIENIKQSTIIPTHGTMAKNSHSLI